jgi:hypothetical protein
MFIAGARDDVLKFPNSQAQIANFSIRGRHCALAISLKAPDTGSRERASTVNKLLLGFLSGL